MINKKIVVVAAVMFILFQGILLMLNPSPDHDSSKSKGYHTTINGTNFYIGGSDDLEYQSWMRCLEFCNRMGMTLISFQTEEKYNLIVNYLTDKGSNYESYWTSGIKLIDKFQWMSTGDLITFTKWDKYSPSTKKAANYCIAFRCTDGWTDWACSNLNQFICEEINLEAS